MRQYAGFGKRIAAYLIDGVLLALAVSIPIACLIGGSFALGGNDEETVLILALVAALICMVWGVVAAVLYFGMMAGRTGQTLGKKWLGIAVVTQDGMAPGFWRSLGRFTIGYAISDMIFGIGFLWMLWDDDKQCLHDKIFGTYVVEV